MANKYDYTSYSAYTYAAPFSAGTVPADGTATATTTLTVSDSSGPGVAQSLQYQAWTSNGASGTAATGAIVTGPAATDAAGKTTLTLTATKPGQYYVKTTNVTTPGDVYYTPSPTAAFVQPSYQASKYSAYNYGTFTSGTVPADGVSPVTTTLTVSGTSGMGRNKPIQAVAWSGGVSGGAAEAGATVTPASGTTNAAGQISFTITANAPGQYQIKATNTADHEDYYSNETAPFIAATRSELKVERALPGNISADRQTPVAVQLTITDSKTNRPLADTPIRFVASSTPAGATFYPSYTAATSGVVTNASGIVQLKLAPFASGASVVIEAHTATASGAARPILIHAIPPAPTRPATDITAEHPLHILDDEIIQEANNSVPKGIRIDIPDYSDLPNWPRQDDDVIEVYVSSNRYHVATLAAKDIATWPHRVYIDTNNFNFSGPVAFYYTVTHIGNIIVSDKLRVTVIRKDYKNPNNTGGTLPVPTYGTHLFNRDTDAIDAKGYVYNQQLYRDLKSALTVIIPQEAKLLKGDLVTINLVLTDIANSSHKGEILGFIYPEPPVLAREVGALEAGKSLSITLPFDSFLKDRFEDIDDHVGMISYAVIRDSNGTREESTPLRFEVDVV